MFKKHQIKLVFIFFYYFSWAQETHHKITFLHYPNEFLKREFVPDKLEFGTNGTQYFLDANQKFLCKVGPNNIKWSGGFGFDSHEFISPVAMDFSNLSLFVLDQSQSRIIEFDQNLHFVSSFETDIFQPQYMWFNPLNELLIFSNSEQSLYKYDLGKQLENVFIDFIQFPHFSGEVISITEGKDGDIGFLTNNPSQIFLFNSMGHFIKVIPVLLEHCLWLEFMNHKWIIFNDSGFYSFPQLSETSTQLPFEIRSIAEKDGIIYALSNDGYFQLNINR